MDRRYRAVVLIALFCLVAICVPAIWLFRAERQERLSRQLIAAMKCGDTAQAIVTLERGADANARDGQYLPAWLRIWNTLRGQRQRTDTAPTPLLILGREDYPWLDDPRLVQALLAHGANVNVVDSDGYNPLVYALYKRRSATARLLINSGQNGTDKQGVSNLLNMAIWSGNDSMTIELMLQHGADPNRPSMFFPFGIERGANMNELGVYLPLGTAIVKGDPATVRCLLRYHADPNRMMFGNRNAVRPLAFAESQHATEIVRMLKDAGAR